MHEYTVSTVQLNNFLIFSNVHKLQEREEHHQAFIEPLLVLWRHD